MGKIALERAGKIAAAVVNKLAPYCEKIEIAGSIRRRKQWVNDIDLVLVPKDPWNLHQQMMRLGQVRMSGKKIIRIMAGDIQLDIYVAEPETWATIMLIRTGSKENNIRLCSRAKDLGWHLSASGDGLFNEKGERIAGDSEISIYNVLGLAYREPWGRD